VVLGDVSGGACASCKYKDKQGGCSRNAKFKHKKENIPAQQHTLSISVPPISVIDPMLLELSDQTESWKERLEKSLHGLSLQEVWARHKAANDIFNKVLDNHIRKSQG